VIPGGARARNLFSANLPRLRGAGFQTCCVAGFQAGSTALPPAGLETRGTADLEVCATLNRYRGRPAATDARTARGLTQIDPETRLAYAVIRMRMCLIIKALQLFSSFRIFPLTTLAYMLLFSAYGKARMVRWRRDGKAKAES
jgi:hypothetical protein